MDNKPITLISGGFDPIHSGHINLINHAGNFGLTIALNSDEWLIRKKGNYFLPWEERAKILRAIQRVARVIEFDDSDDSACDAIAKLKKQYPDTVINFYNGGDRSEGNILEALRYTGDPLVNFFYGTGGHFKANASSDILKRWVEVQHQTTERNWGMYNVLQQGQNYKLKSLVVEPHQSLSMQYHNDRSEHWFVAEGIATAEYQPEVNAKPITADYNKHDLLTIPEGCWHKLSNNTDEDLVIIEIQYGDHCEENDIIRAE